MLIQRYCCPFQVEDIVPCGQNDLENPPNRQLTSLAKDMLLLGGTYRFSIIVHETGFLFYFPMLFVYFLAILQVVNHSLSIVSTVHLRNIFF